MEGAARCQGEEQEPLAFWLETVEKQESRPWQAQRPVAIQVSPAPCAERRKPSATEEWMSRSGRVLHS